jgi:tetratricopeptide (TPR) repeat protein
MGGYSDLVALCSQIDDLTDRITELEEAKQLTLMDLLNLRGLVLGRITDYEWSEELAERLIHTAADGDGAGFLARARSRSIFHRFHDALIDLDTAEQRGLDHIAIQAERVEVLRKLMRYDQAAELCLEIAAARPPFATHAALAIIHAQRGDLMLAETLFSQARCHYVGTSQFPLASLDCRQGVMWHHEGDLSAARRWLEASCSRVPVYAPALARLAEIDGCQGEHHTAIARLHSIVSVSDDPIHAAGLAWQLSAAGRRREAERWRIRAATRFDELARRHPQAFAEHATGFRVATGV